MYIFKKLLEQKYIIYAFTNERISKIIIFVKQEQFLNNKKEIV